MQSIFKNKILGYSSLLLSVFIIATLVSPQFIKDNLRVITGTILHSFGKFYLFLGLFTVILAFIIAISPIGKIKLGDKEKKPEYNWWSWIAMLYSAGMGAGLLLRAVQEPVYYYKNPPIDIGVSNTTLALQYTFFHWGITPWAFYGIFGLIMAYFIYVKKEKVLTSVMVQHIIYNNTLKLILNILTVIITLLGVVAAVGLGSTQIKGGLEHLFNTKFGLIAVILIVLFISLISFFSAWKGIGKGIKKISSFNIFVAILLLLFTAFQGSGSVFVDFFFGLKQYIVDFIPMSLAFGKYNPGNQFLADWTYFYWAFWLAWAPFTGVFIARISKGRTIRQFLFGVLLIPSLGTFLWFSIFANQAFPILDETIDTSLFDNIYTAIFRFFEYYPFTTIINSITVILLVTFLITSIDSAIFVLSMFSDKGNPEPKKSHRIIWGLFLPLFTITVILIGQSTLLQSVSQLLILGALPFGFLLCLMLFAFFKIVLQNKH